MLKKDLRKKYYKLRTELSASSLASKSLTISNSLLELPIWNFDFYHIFLPIGKKYEVDTINILSILQGKDKNVVVPKVLNETSLDHYLLTDNTKFKNSMWGVPEPIEGVKIAPNKIDVVFIPLLAFDINGNRVGYGKGYYDRFLRDCKKDIIKIGLSLFEAEDKITDIDPNDMPLDYCVTPGKTYSFSVTE